jgi:hypothetical protein
VFTRMLRKDGRTVALLPGISLRNFVGEGTIIKNNVILNRYKCENFQIDRRTKW